jgi:hypothetical protein
MVNVGLSWSSIVGIALALSGVGLYFLRSWRPTLARDHDIFFAAVALLCGGILFFQGWRQDPILQFGQFMLTGSAIFFAVESIRLRGIATEQARRSAPIVDEERPVSRSYQYQDAELDYESFEERAPVPRRIRGTPDARSTTYEEEYATAPSGRSRRSSASSRRSSRPSTSTRDDRPATGYRSGDRSDDLSSDDGASRRSRRSRPRPDLDTDPAQGWDARSFSRGGESDRAGTGSRYDSGYDSDYDRSSYDRPYGSTSDLNSDFDAAEPRRRRPRRPRPDTDVELADERSPRSSRRPRPDTDVEPDNSQYVDYQPLDSELDPDTYNPDTPGPDNYTNEEDNSNHFDD